MNSGNQMDSGHVQVAMARILALAATTVTAAVLLVGLASAPSSASCVGPSITLEESTVDRGATVRVTGTGWGDNCYDTGPPPPGEGFLGAPRTDIELYVVQGDRATLVAWGNADQDYGFRLAMPIPATLEPGPATIEATGLDGRRRPAVDQGRPVELTLSTAVVDDDPVVPVEFGPERPVTADSGERAPAGLGTAAVLGGLALVALVVVAIGAAVRRRPGGS